jgi:hypothetical protein
VVAGVVAAELQLPGGLVGRDRIVHISRERITHIGERRPGTLRFCLEHMAEVLGRPECLGFRPDRDTRRVEFIARVGAARRPLLVAVKWLDDRDEAWVSTAHPVQPRYLTRRMSAGTMHSVARGP